jgi:hypothetical protein
MFLLCLNMFLAAKLKNLYIRKTKNRLNADLSNLDGARDRNRTGTGFDPRRILSPVRLPVPPLGQSKAPGAKIF